MRAWFGAILVGGLVALAPAEIRYRLSVDAPARQISVAVTVDAPGAAPVFRIPAWCPGFYFLQSYERKISDVRATAADGTPLMVERPDPRAWRVANPAEGPVTFTYRVLGDDAGLGFFGVNVREDKAFVNGPAAFVHLEGRLAERHTLKLDLPPGWQVATGMTSKVEDGPLSASDYDEFIDHPLQLGAMTKRRFREGGKEFEVAFVSTDNRFQADLDAETERLRKVVGPAMRMFGGAPFERYVFLVHLAFGGFMGGLEHRASTVLAVPNRPTLGIDDLAAHEFFHVWNVKHIRPAVLGPFDYTQPVRTANLWFAEGVTDYYADLITYRSGLHGEDWLYGQFEEHVSELQNAPNRLRFPLEQISRETWEHGGFGKGGVSYYTKGLLVGWILDAAIRDATDGKRSLDDLMRKLFERHRLPKPGFGEDDLRVAINELAGTDLSELYNRCVRSAEELPYEELLKIGLRVVAPGVPTAELAVDVRDGVVVAAPEAGPVRVGDRVLEVSTDRGRVTMEIERDGKRLRVAPPIRVVTPSRWSVGPNPFANNRQIRLREAWLRR